MCVYVCVVCVVCVRVHGVYVCVACVMCVCACVCVYVCVWCVWCVWCVCVVCVCACVYVCVNENYMNHISLRSLDRCVCVCMHKHGTTRAMLFTLLTHKQTMLPRQIDDSICNTSGQEHQTTYFITLIFVTN